MFKNKLLVKVVDKKCKEGEGGDREKGQRSSGGGGGEATDRDGAGLVAYIFNRLYIIYILDEARIPNY